VWLANQAEDDLAFDDKVLDGSEASAKPTSFDRYG
jgi:hypothetical protein